MKRMVLLGAIFTAGGAFAAEPPPADLTGAPPPPAMHEPGVKPREPTAAEKAAVPVAPPGVVAAEAAKAGTPTAAEAAATDGPVAGGMPELPVITVRKQGTDTVEEYRKNGKLYQVRVVPQEGPVKYYIDRIDTGPASNDPRDGPVKPVYFRLLEWK